MQKKFIVVVLVFVLILVGLYLVERKNVGSGDVIKIGVITPLTGAVAYWGESTSIGVQLAKMDLIKEGINVEFIIEDGQLDPKVALNAAQKLVNINKVDAMYSEFNPAAIAVSSFLKDKNILNMYDAAPVSPLVESSNTYKTYLDYEVSCRMVSEILKDRGVERVGVLKMNLEFGELCLKGIKEVYGENIVVEDYNVGVTDFRTPLAKLKGKNVQAVFNVAFQPETLASIRQLRDNNMKITLVGLSEIVSPDIINEYSDLLEGSIMFGLPTVSPEFVSRIDKEFPNQVVGNYQAVALAYIHLKQIARALDKCDTDLVCARNEMNNAKPEPAVGFTGFQNRIAGFDVLIQEWKGGGFVNL